MQDIIKILQNLDGKTIIMEENFEDVLIYFLYKFIIVIFQEDALKFFEFQKNFLHDRLLNWNEFENFSPKKTNVISYEYFINEN